MKKIALMLMMAVAMMFASCTSSDVENSNEKVELSFATNLTTDMQSDGSGVGASRRAASAEASASESYINKLTIADLKNGALVDSVSYKKGTAGYTSPTMITTYGTHTFVFMGRISGANNCSFEGDSLIVFDKPSDLVLATLPLRVTASTTVQNVTLSRVTARILFKISDAIPSNAQTVKLSNKYSYRKWSITNNCATQAEEYETSANISTLVGKKDITISMYTLTPDADLFYTDLFIGFYDAQGNVVGGSEHELSGVNIKRNCVTTISGNYFSSGFGMSVTMDNDFTESVDCSLSDFEQ